MTMVRMGFALSVILLSLKFIVPETASRKFDGRSGKFPRFNHCEDQPILANNALENFNGVLNIVTQNLDFQPLFLSIGTFGRDNGILDRVMEYLGKGTLDYYRFDLKNLKAEGEASLQSGLTWIIVVDRYDALESHVHGHPDFWRGTYRFIVLFVGDETSEPSNDWSDIFHSLWNRHRVSKILITSINTDFRYLYRFMPLVVVDRRFGTVQRLDVETSFDRNFSTVHNNNQVKSSIKDEKALRQVRSKSETIFEDFRKFNGYPIQVTVFPSSMMNVIADKENKTTFTMLDANVMEVVEERLGAEFSITLINTRNVGDPFMKALDTIEGEAGESDIVLTAYFAKLYNRPFEFTTSIFEDRLCLIAPSSEPIPKFLMPVLPFTKELWSILLLYNLVTAILWILIRIIQSRIREGAEFAVSPVDTEIIIPSLCVEPTSMCRPTDNRCFNRPRRAADKPTPNFRPRGEPREIHRWIVGSFDLLQLACYPLYGGKTWPERGFLFGTLFFCLIMTGLYQSCLVSSLSQPLFYPELKTLSDVADSNRTIITKYKNLQENTFNQGTPIADRLQKKIKICASEEKTYDMVAYKGSVSIGRASSFKLENLTEYYNKKTNKLLLHMVEECPARYPLSYPVRLYSPYLQRIDDILLRIKQSGLIQKWYGDMILETKLRVSKNIPNLIDEHVKLSLEHLWLTFLGLGIGSFLSATVFLSELKYARRSHCSPTRPNISHVLTRPERKTRVSIKIRSTSKTRRSTKDLYSRLLRSSKQAIDEVRS